MLRISIAIGMIGAAAAAACGSSNDTAINSGSGGAGTDGGSTGGASAGTSGGGNTSTAGGAGGNSTAGAGGTSNAGAGGAATGGGSSSAGAGGSSNGGAGNGGASGAGNAGAGGSSGSGNGGANTDGGQACVRGVECTGFPTSFVRGCTNDDSCVGEVHQTDCCGALRVMGMNHSEAATFCPAERNECRPQYPTPPGCNSDRVVTDNGNTGSLDNVATRCADITGGVGTCTSFVCGTSTTPACPGTRRIGTCG